MKGPVTLLGSGHPFLGARRAGFRQGSANGQDAPARLTASMLRVACLTLALLVAGCSGGGSDASPGDDPGDASTSATATGGQDNGTSQAGPVLLPIAWDGTLVHGVWWCEGIVFGDCGAAPDDAAFGVDHEVDGAQGNVTGTLELAWTAASAVTDQLVLDASVFTPGCGDCPFEMVGHTAGLSPLTLDLEASVPDGAVLHLSVYVDKYASHPLATVGASGEQDFSVTGTLTLLP